MARTIDAAAIGRSAAAMVARGAAIAEHLQKVNPLRFGQFIRRVELAVRCLRDVVRGDYRLPWKTVAALAAALAYFLSPFDVIPDFLPLTGSQGAGAFTSGALSPDLVLLQVRDGRVVTISR